MVVSTSSCSLSESPPTNGLGQKAAKVGKAWKSGAQALTEPTRRAWLGPILVVPHISSHLFLSSCLCPSWSSTPKSFPRLTAAIQILCVSKSHSSDATCEAHSICSESLSWTHVRWLFLSMYVFSTASEATVRDGATMLYLPPGP